MADPDLGDTRPTTPPPAVPPPGAPPAATRPPQPPDPPGGPSAEAASAPPGLDDRVRSLDAKVVTVWRLTGLASLILPLTGVAVAAFLVLDNGGWYVAVASLGLLALRVAWYPPARFARWRWQLTPLALELRYGIVVRIHEAVPYFRIQQIDISQGPIDRLVGLATLQVTTASASGSASLPGLDADDAPRVRAELLSRAAEAVAGHPGDLQDAV